MVVLCWILVALYAAYCRSFWCDEFNRLGQMHLGLTAAIRSVFGEPSPFAPGEIVLQWICERLFSAWLPTEIWARLPGIGWGAGAVVLALSMRNRYLTLLTVFSAALWSLSLEARPYASLFFAGALALKILWETSRKKASPALECAIWFTLAFTHLYGICFVAFACALRKRWAQAALGATYVVFILSHYHFAGAHGAATYSISEILRQTLGTLGNPHKAVVVLLPAAVFGFFSVARKKPRLALELAALAVVAIICPILATVKSGYFFTPRQIVGGSFLFLTCAAIGFETVVRYFPLQKKIAERTALSACLVAAIVPWTLSSWLAVPPFPNVPFHHFRELSQRLVAEHARSILYLDPCNRANMEYYLSRSLGSQPGPQERFTFGGQEFEKRCWDSLCLYELTDSRFCSDENVPPALLASSGLKYDVLVHSFKQPPVAPSSVRVFRTW